MDFNDTSIATLFGIVFGLIFVGLFLGGYALDRKARYVLWYLAGALALIASGLSYLLSMVTPHTKVFIALVEIGQSLGLIGLAYGFVSAFSIRVSASFLWTVFVAGAGLTIAFGGHTEMSTARLVAVSAWHAIVATYLVIQLLRVPHATFKHHFIAALVALTGLAIMARPLVAVLVRMDASLSPAEQLETYGLVVSTIYLTAVFGLAAAIFFHVMSELVTAYRNASLTDSMTGLLNRRGFVETVERITTPPAAIIMLDIDRFKSINDRFGHEVGDRVITAVGTLLDRNVPAPHLAGRLGGEEFAVALWRSEASTAVALAQSLRVAIEYELADQLPVEHTVTASFGVAPIGAGGLRTALLQADQALYQAKQNGRNRVCLADPKDAGQGPRIVSGKSSIGVSG